MNKRSDNERLLADVLSPEADPGFSSALLTLTLRQVRRRRRIRQLRRYGGALAGLAAIVILISSQLRRAGEPGLLGSPLPVNCHLVITQPLSTDQIVNTQPLAPNQLAVTTVAAREVRTATGGFREVGDDELIALAAPQVVALVRRGPHEAELVFVNSPPDNSDSHQN